jgi:hypothetical protein
MATAVLAQTPNMTAAQFDAVAAEIGLSESLPQGCLVHIAGVGQTAPRGGTSVCGRPQHKQPSRLGRRSRPREPDRRLVHTRAIPIAREAPKSHARACCTRGGVADEQFAEETTVPLDPDRALRAHEPRVQTACPARPRLWALGPLRGRLVGCMSFKMTINP